MDISDTAAAVTTTAPRSKRKRRVFNKKSKGNNLTKDMTWNSADTSIANRLTSLLAVFDSTQLTTLSRIEYESSQQQFAHQVLRLVFSEKRDDVKRWYVEAEAKLFLDVASKKTRRMMLSDIPRRTMEECTQDEEKSHGAVPTSIQLGMLMNALGDRKPPNIKVANTPSSLSLSYEEEEEEFFYLLNFERVPNHLMRNRRVVLSRGTAFVPSRYEEDLCANTFIMDLKRNLVLARKIKKQIFQRDPRIEQLCNQASTFFQKRYRYIQSSSNTASVTEVNAAARQNVARANVDLYAKRSMPLCMSSLYEELHLASHLKYNGRFQLQGFLKGIGFTLQDSLMYWRQAFSKKFNPRDFERKYAYSIRHYYGKVGKRYDRPPLNCDKIITKLPAPGPGQFHGCPFKYWGESALRTHMQARQIRSRDMKNILNLAENKEYQASCREYFQATHEGTTIQLLLDETDTDVGITPSEHHPNLYFEASEIFFNEKRSGDNGDDGEW